MTIPEYFDEDSVVWLAMDIPEPRRFAEMLLMTRRDICRELLAVKRNSRGEWKFPYDPDSVLIHEIRALGLADVAGTLNPPSRTGPGWDATSWAMVVRNRLMQILATRELETPLENEGEDAAQ